MVAFKRQFFSHLPKGSNIALCRPYKKCSTSSTQTEWIAGLNFKFSIRVYLVVT